MSKNSFICRKRVIVFGFEGKNNKTETNYFSHFKPKDTRYILKLVSCGVTDPVNMLKSIKNKRSDFDYNAKEDLTFLFVDIDSNREKDELVERIKTKLPKDIVIIKSNPCFELWFLNHFCRTTKEFNDSDDLIDELKKYIKGYDKTKDYHKLLSLKVDDAISNSRHQKDNEYCNSVTDVVDILNVLVMEKE